MGQRQLPWPADYTGDGQVIPPSIPATNLSKLSISTNVISGNSDGLLTSVATYQSEDHAVIADIIGFSISPFGNSTIPTNDLLSSLYFEHVSTCQGDFNGRIETTSSGGFTCAYNTELGLPVAEAVRVNAPEIGT